MYFKIITRIIYLFAFVNLILSEWFYIEVIFKRNPISQENKYGMVR